MARKSKFSPEVRERAIGLVRETRPSHDSEWAAITSVAEKMGCTPETLRKWMRQSQRDQYLSIRHTDRLAEAGIEGSVGSKGDSYDNALAEAVNALSKTEVIYRRGPWRSREAVELAVLEWIDWFNSRRPLEPLGYVPPAEFEAAYYAKQSDPAMVVGFN